MPNSVHIAARIVLETVMASSPGVGSVKVLTCIQN
jgi:hypothetical protein